VFSAKKILINISFGEENPLMMEEMNALHDFMSKFSREIEVIWGTAVEDDLKEDVKVTLLATGFSIKDVPELKSIVLLKVRLKNWNGKYAKMLKENAKNKMLYSSKNIMGKKVLKPYRQPIFNLILLC
jgi:cell division protein FtsZ